MKSECESSHPRSSTRTSQVPVSRQVHGCTNHPAVGILHTMLLLSRGELDRLKRGKQKDFS
jgi:hypothetical protein